MGITQVTETDALKGFAGLADLNQSTSGIVKVGEYLHVPYNSRFASPNLANQQPATRAAVFLDRDGVIIEDVHYLRSPSRLRLLPGASSALRMLQDRFYIIVVTNQSGIARGLLTEDDLLEIHSELVRCLATEGAVLDALYWCPHLPEAAVPEYQAECDCRKPKPGMLLRAESDWGVDMAHSFIVGDTNRDIEAGYSVGVKSILLSTKDECLPEVATCIPDLAHAAEFILMQTQRRMEP